MRERIIIFFAILGLLASSCISQETGNPYADTLCSVTVKAVYPEGYADAVKRGVKVTLEDINLGNVYVRETEPDGTATFRVSNGLYRINVSDVGEEDIFNGTSDKVNIDSDRSVSVPLLHSKPGAIIIKEIYCGGCKRLPQEGNYQADKYVILHNNNYQVKYLDGLCFGTLFPYNSNATNPFTSKDPVTGETIFQDYLPIAQAVWQFGGDGTTFPLQPGEDAVLCLSGAIDHTVQYPLSVNLNKPEYFVCYNNTYFTNTTYHPAPGDQIAQDHILDVVVKTGIANAYTFSINSPTAVLFQAQGMTMDEFLRQPGSIVQVPGSTNDQVAAIPLEWVIDAVEVFNGASSSNSKRLAPSMDAGYVTQTDSYLGHTLFRRTDEALTASSGYEVLVDTNNSTNDFYERETQSLHE